MTTSFLLSLLGLMGMLTLALTGIFTAIWLLISEITGILNKLVSS